MLPSSVKLLLRLPLILLALVILAPPQALSHYLNLPTRHFFPPLAYRIALYLAGIKLRVHGERPKKSTLILSNHVSWLDIFLLGSVMPTRFVAGSHLAKWFFFGQMAKIGGTIFINRDRRHDVANQRDTIKKYLLAGERIVLFPEGSTSDGTIVLPFKSSLLSVAETTLGSQSVPVQAASLVFSELCGLPMGRRMRLEYAWTSRYRLLPHMLKILGGDTITVDLIFHPPLYLSEIGDRKALATRAQRQSQSGLAAFTAGHDTEWFSLSSLSESK